MVKDFPVPPPPHTHPAPGFKMGVQGGGGAGGSRTTPPVVKIFKIVNYSLANPPRPKIGFIWKLALVYIQRGDDPVGGETLTSLSECSIMASSLDSDGPSSMTLQVVSKHCTCVVPLLRAANYARSLVKEENS